MTIMLETIKPPESGLLDIDIHVTADIRVRPEIARRRVSVFVGNQIADLLHGETPDLVLRESGAYWRVPVVLSSCSLGRIGRIGTIDVNVETGELMITDQMMRELELHAQRLAAGAAL